MEENNCAHQLRRIDRAVDGDLSGDELASFKAHIEECGACKAAYRARLQVTRVVRAEGTRHVASADFADRIRALSEPPKQKRAAWWVGGAGGMALAASVALFITLPSSQDALTRDLLNAHIRALQGTHLIDVASSDRHTVKPWFNGKIDLSPTVVDLADQDFPLVGGRLDYVDEHPAAALVYRHGQHVVDVFVWANPGGDNSVETLRKNGYNVQWWRSQGTGYGLVSDLNPTELEGFRRLWINRTASQP